MHGGRRRLFFVYRHLAHGIYRHPFSPLSRIFSVDCRLNLRDFLSLLVHGIRIQRNVLAHHSRVRVPIRVAIQVILMVRHPAAPAIARHLFEQLRHFLGNPIGFGQLSSEQCR